MYFTKTLELNVFATHLLQLWCGNEMPIHPCSNMHMVQIMYEHMMQIDLFTNTFKFYAYLLNKDCSWQPESLAWCLPNIATTNVSKLDSKYCNVFASDRLME